MVGLFRVIVFCFIFWSFVDATMNVYVPVFGKIYEIILSQTNPTAADLKQKIASPENEELQELRDILLQEMGYNHNESHTYRHPSEQRIFNSLVILIEKEKVIVADDEYLIDSGTYLIGHRDKIAGNY